MVTQCLSALPAQLGELRFPPASRRSVWERVDTRLLIEGGEEYRDFSWPPLTAGDYLSYIRTGERTGFEKRYFSRRRALCALVLAECAEYKGRFLGDIANGIWALCEESGWQLPAHNSYLRDAPALPLPDPERPVLDLFACETGALLALIPPLLEAELSQVSPQLCRRISHELKRRIFRTYLQEHFWWMGRGDEPMCNWTAWCTQNVLLAVFASGQTQAVRHAAAEKAAYSLDCFLKDYGEDGCCEEGALYYRHGGLALWGSLEILNAVSSGCFEGLWGERKIQNIAAYIANVHVKDGWYLNYADCSPRPGPCGVREFLFGARTENPALMVLAAGDWLRRSRRDLPQEINLWYRLMAAFRSEQVLRFARGAERKPLPPAVFYPSTGLWIAREKDWCVSVRAGPNGGSHGHNDSGSLIVYGAGRPLLIDIGVESYTAKTFSDARYEIWTMRSDWHNLPVINGCDQGEGRAFGAEIVGKKDVPGEHEIDLELSRAYPPEAGDFSYRRTVALSEREGLSVTDRYQGRGQAVLSLLLCERPVYNNGRLEVGERAQILLSGGIPEVEAVPISDTRLRQAWPDTLYRACIPFSGTLNLQFRLNLRDKE